MVHLDRPASSCAVDEILVHSVWAWAQVTVTVSVPALVPSPEYMSIGRAAVDAIAADSRGTRLYP